MTLETKCQSLTKIKTLLDRTQKEMKEKSHRKGRMNKQKFIEKKEQKKNKSTIGSQIADMPILCYFRLDLNVCSVDLTVHYVACSQHPAVHRHMKLITLVEKEEWTRNQAQKTNRR